MKCFFGTSVQEAKATAAFKAQIEKLQQERDEFQRMVIGNQVITFGYFGVLFAAFESCHLKMDES